MKPKLDLDKLLGRQIKICRLCGEETEDIEFESSPSGGLIVSAFNTHWCREVKGLWEDITTPLPKGIKFEMHGKVFVPISKKSKRKSNGKK